jgi:hypothetical protein
LRAGGAHCDLALAVEELRDEDKEEKAKKGKGGMHL